MAPPRRQDGRIELLDMVKLVYIYIYTYIYIHRNIYIYTYNGGIPKWMVYNGKPIKIDDLGVPPF